MTTVALTLSATVGLVMPAFDAAVAVGPALASETAGSAESPSGATGVTGATARIDGRGEETPGAQPADPAAEDPANPTTEAPAEPGAGGDTEGNAEQPAEGPAAGADKAKAKTAQPLGTPVARAVAGGDYCTVPGVYSLDAGRNVREFPLGSGSSAVTGTFAAPASGALNGLAITPDGTEAYAAVYLTSGTNRYQIQRLLASDSSGSAITLTNPNMGNPTNSGAVTVGAIDPTGTYYYFGNFTSSSGTNNRRLELFAVNLKTNAWIGQVGRVTMTGASNVTQSGIEGDIAFDQNGAMLILWGSGTTASSRLYRVDNPPVVAGTTTITPTQLAQNISSTNTYPWNGLAFDTAGNLWLQRQASATQSYRQRLDPSSGLVSGTGAQITTNFLGNDLASCGLPRPYMTFEVRDTTGNLVGGATVEIQGPKTNNSSDTSNSNWGGNSAVYPIADCVSGPCGSSSLDRDPRPGYFQVDRLTAGANPVWVSTSNRYRMRPATAPSGYGWVTSNDWVAIPAVSSNSSTPASNAWQFDGTTYAHAFPNLEVQSFTPVCTTGYSYVLDDNAMKQVSPTGAVSSIGSASGVTNGLNGLGISPGGTKAYAFEREGTSTSDTYRGRIYVYDTATGTWSRLSSGNTWDLNIVNGTLVAGAVGPTGTYYAGGFQSGGDFRLMSMNAAGTAMVENGYIDLGEYANGDIAFDDEGNLYLVRGRNENDFRRTVVLRVAAADLLAAAGTTNALPYTTYLTETPLEGMATGAAINGAGFDADGRLYVSTATALYSLSLPGSNTATGVALSGGSFSSVTDLATCMMPPLVKLQKLLPDGRAVPGDAFPLEIRSGGSVSGSGNQATLSGGTSLGTATATAPASGVQDQVVGSFPVTVGQTVSFAETLTTAQRANYASGYECTIDGAPLSPVVKGAATARSFAMPAASAGKTVLCTFTNSIVKASKSASPASGTLVQADGFVTYTLTFDNSAGLGPATLQHRDHMGDVLDDAFFVNSAGNEVTGATAIQNTFAITGIAGTNVATWDAANQRINVSGTVAAGAVGTVSFRVKVRANGANADARETSAGGYLLRNYLTRNTVTTPPTSCAPANPATPATCTEHPVNAWSVKKESLPATTARLHTGGNAHYKITATKMSGATDLKQLVLTDDLTQVFKTAGWAPDAAVPNGAKAHGVYIFNAAGDTIDLSGTVTPVQPTRVQDVTTPTLSGGRWTLTSGAPIDVPAQGVRVEMWFAVQAGERPAALPDRLLDGSPGDPWAGADAPATGWKFVNYATGAGRTGSGGSTALNPNACITGVNVPNTGLAPDATQPADTSFPARCQVQHELSANYFTIRKDAGGAGVSGLANDDAWDPDPTGLWNMVGHEFEIRDDVAGAPSSYASTRLCRVEYNPNPPHNWNGSFTVTGGTPDWGENSATLAAIKTWNNLHPDDQRPLCGLLYPISSGPQEGRWRSENLPSASASQPGEYWLVETKAPDRQTDTDASDFRDVPGVQLLAEPIAFVVWPEGDGPATGQSMRGRSQLDVSDGAGDYLDRCDPDATVAARPTACVNPTGYLMIVKDPTPLRLPLMGGNWLAILTVGGAILFVAAFAGIWWWRRRRDEPLAPGGDAH